MLYHKTLAAVDPEMSEQMFDRFTEVELRVCSYILQNRRAIGPQSDYLAYGEEEFKLRDRLLADEQKVIKVLQKAAQDDDESETKDPQKLLNEALRHVVPVKSYNDVQEEELKKQAAKQFAEKMRKEALERAQRHKEQIAKDEELKTKEAEMERLEEERKRNKELRKRQNENLMRLQAVNEGLYWTGQRKT